MDETSSMGVVGISARLRLRWAIPSGQDLLRHRAQVIESVPKGARVLEDAQWCQ